MNMTMTPATASLIEKFFGTPEERAQWILDAFRANHLTVPGDAFVYILEFEGGIVKVGQTFDYASRMKSHKSSRVVRPRQVISEWRQPTSSALEDEATLKRLVLDMGGVPWRGREWFTGVDVPALWERAAAEIEPAPDPPMTVDRFKQIRDAVVDWL